MAATKSKKNVSSKNNQEFVIVIDAGHGGHDTGAIDNNAREKDINLGVAKKFAEQVKKKLKNVKVIMTRDDDTFISLQERANIANRNRANLFVSIHTNSVDKSNPNRKTVSGTSVYSLGPQKDANNLKVAQRENSVIELEGDEITTYSDFDPSKDESYIIFEMSQKKNLGQSLKFANLAQKELVGTAGRKDRGVKQAGFLVLWATSMPSVLVELDFICNPTEAQYLSSDKGQRKLAESLTNALEKYIKSTSAKASSGSKRKATATADFVETTESELAVSTEPNPDGVNTLVSPSPSSRERKAHAATNSNNHKAGYAKARKRRSSASKQASDSRKYETEKIELRSETELYARQEVEKVEVKEPVKQETDQVKGKKKKKNKKKEKKQNKKTPKSNSASTQNKVVASTNTVSSKTDDNASSKSTQKEAKSKKGKKTFTVKSNSATTATTTKSGSNSTSVANSQSSGTVKTQPRYSRKPTRKVQEQSEEVIAEVATTEEHRVSTKSEVSDNIPKSADKGKSSQARPTLKQHAEQGTTVYKILVATSTTKLAKNDPVFGGIVPTGMFVENGEYKYTFGESTSRREIEKTFMEIQSTVPSATIIVRTE